MLDVDPMYDEPEPYDMGEPARLTLRLQEGLPDDVLMHVLELLEVLTNELYEQCGNSIRRAWHARRQKAQRQYHERMTYSEQLSFPFMNGDHSADPAPF